MDTTKLVDVIIPTYNNDSELDRAIESVFIQGKIVNRIFVLDDGNEESLQSKLISRYSKNPIVEYIPLKHTGHPGIVRSIGIQRSTAKWIAFLDADDFWNEGKLEIQLQAAREFNAIGVTSNASTFQDGNKGRRLIDKVPQKINFEMLIKDNIIVNSMVIVQKEALLKVGGYADSYRATTVEDYATWLRLLTFNDFIGVDLELGCYQISTNSIRSQNIADPRIHAITDYLVWSNSIDESENRMIRRKRKLALKAIGKQYGR
jgi:teichuronic acid biosynthesis glycosyltransferase TuaG